MKRLTLSELHKLMQNRTVLLGIILALATNLFFLWSVNTHSGIPVESYRKAGIYLQGMTTDEQVDYLSEHVELLETMYRVEDTYRWLAQGKNLNNFDEKAKQFYNEHLDAYLAGGFLDICRTIPEELQICKELLLEAQEVQKYPQILQQIQVDASQISSISIFQKDVYRTKETEAAAKVFAGMEDVQVTYYPAVGLMRAINQKVTDLLLLDCMLVISLGLVRADMDSGLMTFIQTHRRGKNATAAAKILAFCLALLIPVLLLYGENLLYCTVVYGLGPMSRSIQSLPAFSRCALKITVGEYLVLFLVVKWVAACITGFFAMVICLMTRQAYTGYLATVLFWLGCGLVRSTVSATGHWNLFKYANPISMMQTNELLGIWKSIYWFGNPVPRYLVESLAAVVFSIVCCGIFGVVFCRKNFARGASSRLSRKENHPVKYQSICGQECYKIFILQGVALILAAFFVIQINGAVQKKVYLLPDELCYQKCMTELSGPWNTQAYQTWTELKEKAWPEQEEEENYLLQDVLRSRVYPEIQRVAASQKEGSTNQIIYATGYEQLLRLDNEADQLLNANIPRADTARMAWAAVCAALVTICCVGIFALEKTTNLEYLLGTARLGRGILVKTKVIVAWSIAITVGLSVYLPQLMRVLHWFGLPALNAPAESLSQYRESIVARWPLWGVLLMDLAGVLTGCIVMACVVCWLAHRLKNVVTVVVGASIFFALPALLGLIKIRQLCPLSIFPLFSVGVQLQNGGTTIALLAMAFVWGVLAWLCITDLRDTFGKS